MSVVSEEAGDQHDDAAENNGLRVAMLTPWRARCGISDYSHLLADALDTLPQIASVRIVEPPATPLLSARTAVARFGALEQQYRALGHALNEGANLAHVQHQYFFFGGVAPHKNHFRAVLNAIRVPLVMTVHEVVAPVGSFLHRGAIALTNRRNFVHPALRALIVHTHDDKALLTATGVPSESIHVVTHGIPAPQPLPDAEDAKRSLGLTGRRVVTLFGFLSAKKGHDAALDALRLLPDDVFLLLAGDQHPDDHTDYVPHLKQRIKTEGLANRVRITGYLPHAEIPTIMAATDVAIAPYTQTSGSGSLANLLAYGRAIVASNIAPHRDLLAQGKDSLLLFDVHQAVSLAKQITTLLEDAPQHRALQMKARAFAQAHSYAEMARATAAIYEEALNARPSVPHGAGQSSASPS